MNACLDGLENPTVFVSTAALIVIVLLVWAQLQAGGRTNDRNKRDRNVNYVCGFAWTYLAILFALIAVAIFVYDKTCPWGKGFLILSFLMTCINIFISLAQSIARIFKPSGECLGEKSSREKIWSVGWLAGLVGLALISFSLAYRSEWCNVLFLTLFWIGKVILIGAGICGVIKIIRDRKKK